MAWMTESLHRQLGSSPRTVRTLRLMRVTARKSGTQNQVWGTVKRSVNAQTVIWKRKFSHVTVESCEKQSIMWGHLAAIIRMTSSVSHIVEKEALAVEQMASRLTLEWFGIQKIQWLQGARVLHNAVLWTVAKRLLFVLNLILCSEMSNPSEQATLVQSFSNCA